MKITKLFATFALLSLSIINISAEQQKQYEYPFQNPDLQVDQRVDDLISRLTLEEKVSQMQNISPAIERLGVAAYEWWNEALHGVARVKGVDVGRCGSGQTLGCDHLRWRNQRQLRG